MVLEEAVLIDTTLLFALRSAPKILSASADTVEWILKEAALVFHCLDDLLIEGTKLSKFCIVLYYRHFNNWAF